MTEVNPLSIGMFGTCGGSTWRDGLIARYKEQSINFYNPQVENWTPGCAKEEAEHLAVDKVILFPVLDETYAFGSLTEVGFSILQAIKLEDRRDFVILIHDHLTAELMKDEDKAKDSLKSRALVFQHLKKLRLPNLYLVDTLEEMYVLSVILYRQHEKLIPLQEKFNPHQRKY